MSHSNRVLVSLAASQDSESFLISFHQKLKELQVELSEGNYVVFTDGRNEEEHDPLLITSRVNEKSLITEMVKWGSLGTVPYRHDHVKLPFHINYISWDAVNISAFEIMIDHCSENYSNKDIIMTFIKSLIDSVDFEFAVGSLGNSPDDFPIEENSDHIQEYIKDKVFDIDIRRMP